MYKLVIYGTETTSNDPEDPGSDAMPDHVRTYVLVFDGAREDRLHYHNDKFKTFRKVLEWHFFKS
jgi:hypothetical protein